MTGEGRQQVRTVRTRGPQARRALMLLCTDRSPDRLVDPPIGILSRGVGGVMVNPLDSLGHCARAKLKAIRTTGRLGHRTHRTPPVKAEKTDTTGNRNTGM